VALSCTEIPLLITPEVSPLPTLDSTRLLAREAVATALGERTAEWRGGPLPSHERRGDGTSSRASAASEGST